MIKANGRCVLSMLKMFLGNVSVVINSTPVSCWLALFVLIAGIAWIQYLPAELVKYLNSEQGPFEQFSVAFLSASALFAFASCVCVRSAKWLAAGVIFVYATLRELDFQTMFTYRSIMSLGYYTRDRAILSEKLIVLILIAPCLLAIAYLSLAALKGCRKDWLMQAASRQLLALGFWVVVLFVLSHLSDRTTWFRLQGHVEAWVEAVLAFAVLLLVVEIKPRLLTAPPNS